MENLIKKLEKEIEGISNQLDKTEDWLTMSASYKQGLLDAYNHALLMVKMNRGDNE